MIDNALATFNAYSCGMYEQQYRDKLEKELQELYKEQLAKTTTQVVYKISVH